MIRLTSETDILAMAADMARRGESPSDICRPAPSQAKRVDIRMTLPPIRSVTYLERIDATTSQRPQDPWDPWPEQRTGYPDQSPTGRLLDPFLPSRRQLERLRDYFKSIGY